MSADSSEFAVRRARGGDVDQVARFWIALTLEHARSDASFALRNGAESEVRLLVGAILSDPASQVWLAESKPGDASVGLGCCIARVDEAPPIHVEDRRGEITDLYVVPAERRAGIARALVGQADRWLRGRGVARVEVRVAAKNATGRAFWQASGFAPFVDVLHRRM